MTNEIFTEISTNKYDLAHRNCGYNVLTYILDDITHDRIGLYCDQCGKVWRITSIECVKGKDVESIRKNLSKAFPEKTVEQIKIMLSSLED